jgi:DNA repair protein RadC
MSTVVQLDLLPASTNRLAHLKPAQLSPDEQTHVIELALQVLSRRYQPGERIDHPGRMRDYLRLRLSEREHEIFALALLDNRHRVLRFEELFRGTVDGCSVYPRVIVQMALKVNAAAVILAHNHPSSVPDPSQADLKITQRIREALALVDIRVLDHFILTRQSVLSFAESGLL